MQTPKQEIEGILEQLIEDLGDGGMDTSYHGHDYDGSMERAVQKISELKKQAEKESIERAIEVVEELKNPYPVEVFREITASEGSKIHKLLQEHLNVPLDIVSGSMGRLAFNNTKKDALEALKTLLH